MLAAIDDYLGRQVSGRGGCLAVECPNSVPGALTLLYLLQQEISFVLLPPSELGEQTSAWKPIPHFCQARLVVKRAPAKAPSAPSAGAQTPADFLGFEANPAYQSPASPELHTPGYLFLRTSGSMGASKLVAHTHATLLVNAQGCVEQYQYTSADRLTLPVPIAHMYGLGVGFLPAILAGASLDLQDQTNLFRYLAHEKRFNPTMTCVTPTLCTMLLKGFKNPRRYRLAITATQRINEATFRAFDAAIGGSFVNQYGSSEMGAIAVCAPDDDLTMKATTIGKPFPGVKLKVQTIDEASEGEGELFCQHPAGFVGYVDESGAWLHRQSPAAWYRTGDLAECLPNGYFQITGRAGNSMNRRGYLVHFADIERGMEQMAGLEQVVVVGKEDAERITAFCVLSNKAQFTDAQIREQSFQLLPPYAIPDEVRLLDALPLLPTGKVDRQKLTAMVSQIVGEPTI
jgi:acyl-coenzyme A synthetase/AMP-(fatty) acid ligase